MASKDSQERPKSSPYEEIRKLKGNDCWKGMKIQGKEMRT